MKELELLISCLKGERKGQRLLYETYCSTMEKLCLRYIKDHQDAYHVMTEGFLKVFTKIKSFEYREEGSLAAWIRKIIVNECLMFLRVNKQLKFIELDEMPFDSTGFDICHISANEILELVKSLPPGYRTIFNLYAIEGYSHKEIGELLGILEATSRSQLTHARARLREILIKNGYTNEGARL